MKKLSVIAATSVAFMAAPSFASTILIDDFSVAGETRSNGSTPSSTGGNPDVGAFPDAGILGGERFMWVSSDSAPSPNSATSFEADAGQLRFGNTTDITGQAVVVYDGVGTGVSRETFEFHDVPTALVPSVDFPSGTQADIPVNTSGLGTAGVGIDFLQGDLVTQRAFEFGVASFDDDGELDFRAYVWDMDGDLATYDELLKNPSSTAELDFDTLLPFTDFAFTADFDWDNIGAIAFSVESLTTEFDGALTSISVVPLPLSALLLLGGLGGLAGASTISKRRRQKA